MPWQLSRQVGLARCDTAVCTVCVSVFSGATIRILTPRLYSEALHRFLLTMDHDLVLDALLFVRVVFVFCFFQLRLSDIVSPPEGTHVFSCCFRMC